MIYQELQLRFGYGVNQDSSLDRSSHTANDIICSMVQGPPNAEETAMTATVAIRDFTGVWIKDRAASDLDSYARTLDLMKLGGLQKVRFISFLF